MHSHERSEEPPPRTSVPRPGFGEPRRGKGPATRTRSTSPSPRPPRPRRPGCIASTRTTPIIFAPASSSPRPGDHRRPREILPGRKTAWPYDHRLRVILRPHGDRVMRSCALSTALTRYRDAQSPGVKIAATDQYAPTRADPSRWPSAFTRSPHARRVAAAVALGPCQSRPWWRSRRS